MSYQQQRISVGSSLLLSVRRRRWSSSSFNPTTTKTTTSPITIGTISVSFFLLLLLSSLLLLNVNIVVVDAKVTSGQFRLSGVQTEYILGSFAMVPSGGHIELKLSTTKPNVMYTNEKELLIHAYRDTEWNSQFKKAPTCVEKITYAKNTGHINFDYNRDTNLWTARTELTIKDQFITKKPQADRDHYWYFVIDDCSLEQYYQDDTIPVLQYELKMMNHEHYYLGGGSGTYETHYSADQMFLEYCHMIVTLLSTIVVILLLVYISKQLLRRYTSSGKDGSTKGSSSSSSSLHIAVVWITAAAILDMVSSITEQMHLDAYYFNGVGVYTLDAVSAHCEALCDALLSLFLLSISTGWTLPESVITFPAIDTTSSNTNCNILLRGLRSVLNSIQKPVVAFVSHTKNRNVTVFAYVVVLLHTGIAQWSRIYNDEQESYHNYHHLPGQILLFVRSTLGLFYILKCMEMKQRTSNNIKLTKFYTTMIPIGIVWFLSIPLVTLFCNTFIPYYQQLLFITVSTAIIQSTSILVLAWFVTFASTSFHTYSHLNIANTTNEATFTDSVLLLSSTSSLTTKGTGGTNGAPTGSATTITSSSSNSTTSGVIPSWSFGKTKIRLD